MPAEACSPRGTAGNALSLVLSLDIDGTMEFGRPPGPITAIAVSALVPLGVVVGVASDWPRSAQRGLWVSNGIDPVFVGGKHDLVAVRSTYVSERYVHIGDTDVDREYATAAGFEFVDVHDIPSPLDLVQLVDPTGRHDRA